MGLGDDQVANALAAEVVMCDNPIKVKAAFGPGNGTITGIGNGFSIQFGEQEMVIALFAQFQPVLNEFKGNRYFKIVKKSGREDHLPDSFNVFGSDSCAKCKIGVHHGIIFFLHQQ